MTLDGRLAKKCLLILIMMLIALFAVNQITSHSMGEFGETFGRGLAASDTSLTSASHPAIASRESFLGKANFHKPCAASSRRGRTLSDNA